MNVRVKRILRTGLVCLLPGWWPASGQTAAQPRPLMAADVFTHVQVLKGIPVDQFMETMGFFSAPISAVVGPGQLGEVRCTRADLMDQLKASLSQAKGAAAGADSATMRKKKEKIKT